MRDIPRPGDRLSILHTGENVVFVKVCKSGLYQVRLLGTTISEPDQFRSLPKRKLTFATSEQADSIMTQLRRRLENVEPEGWRDDWSGVYQVEGERRHMEHKNRARPLYSLEQIEHALKGK